MSTQTKELFTQGDWAIRDLEIIGPLGSNKSICEITGNFMDEDEAKANACLLLQAKNMYEAIRGFVENAMDDKRIAPNQINYYKGVFQKILEKANPQQ